jgi:Tol biopolymer transport system component
MTGITHKQAKRYLRAAADGLLIRDNQRALLDAHMHECASCRAEADELSVFEARLKKNFQARWDANDGPSKNVMSTIQSRSRRIIMSNRINIVFRSLAGIAMLVVLGFVLNYATSRLQNTPVAANETQKMEDGKSKEDNSLIAFTSKKDGNLDIYTMHADGSELTNLTNNSAQDVSPVWSPDGKRIAFESDRDGFRQIFLMNADGSNVIQLTDDEADHWIGEPYNLSLNLWSPDGNKLIFLQIAPGDEKGMLYIIDANGENKKPLVKEAGKYYSPSWSPDGKHVAFIALENSVYRIYSTEADGNNLTNVTKKLTSDETLYPVNYYWSRDGQSISFIVSNWYYLLGSGGESFPDYKWMAYEASLDGNTLVTNASTHSQIGGYWNGTYFLSGSAVVSSSPTFTWVHSDGTSTMANPIEKCQKLLNDNTGSYMTGYSSYKQSPNGNIVIGAYCPNGDKWLFWADSKGAFRQLLNSPIHVEGTTSSNAMNLWAPPDFIWSSDDRYIAFNIFSLGKTDMYVVNAADALKDPSIQPFYITIGNGSLYYSPVWQPYIP